MHLLPDSHLNWYVELQSGYIKHQIRTLFLRMACHQGLHLNDKHTRPSQIISISDVTGLNFPTWPCLFVFSYIITSDFWDLLAHFLPSPTFSLYLPGLKPNSTDSSACWRGTDSIALPLWNYLEITFPFVPRPAELIFQLGGQWEQGSTEWDGWKTEKSKGKEGKWQVAESTPREQRGQMWSRRWGEETRGQRGDMRWRQEWNYHCKQTDRRQTLIPSDSICPVLDVSVSSRRWVAEEDRKGIHHFVTAVL